MGWLKKLIKKVGAWISAIKNMSVRSRYRLGATIIAILLTWASIHYLWPSSTPQKTDATPEIALISYSEFLHKVESSKIKEVTISHEEILMVLKDGTKVRTNLDSRVAPPVDALMRHNVRIVFSKSPSTTEVLQNTNYTIFLTLLIWGVWVYMFFRGIGPRGEIRFPFQRKKVDTSAVTFVDVAGVDEAKAELQEIVDFLKNPNEFAAHDAPRGVLMVGPSGTGKTLLARAVAGEARVPFHFMAGSDFVEMFVGVGARRVRNLSDKAKEKTPCIIYIDEIDSVGSKRTGDTSGGNREYQQTTNMLLSEMDGFEQYPGVIWIASTNIPENLDPALLRRFDCCVTVPLPDAKGREEILKVHTRNRSLDSDVNLKMLAAGTPGFSGDGLAKMVKQAAKESRKESLLLLSLPSLLMQKIAMRHFASAKDKVMMGAERKSLVLTDEDKLRTAYHEVGHAFVALRTTGSDPVEKVSIMPRGRSLGVTIQLPTADRHHYTKSFLVARMAIMMGGRAAEEIFFEKDISAGAESDIEEATKLASHMVCRWGMSSLGPLALKKRTGGIHMDGGSVYDCSPDLAFQADEEIRRLINESLDKAMHTIENERDTVKYISEELFRRTEMSGKEILQILEKKSPSKNT